MKLVPLTRRQREIVDFFERYSRERGLSPTLEEIAQSLGVNKVTIFGHVAELERKGVLQRARRGISRGLTLVPDSYQETPKLSPTRVPILGRIAAGRPLEVVEETEEFDLGELLPRGANAYALRVRGDSMIEDSICDGDLVLVERRTEAKNGEVVVAVLPGEEATLKRFYREGETIRLQPANSTMAPIRTVDVEIRGVVLGVVRQF